MPPKNKGESTTRPNRIRFIMLDADISDGNLAELTQAITIALRSQPSQRPPAAAPVRELPAGNAHPIAAADLGIEDAEVVQTDAEAPVEPAAPAKPRSASSPRQPKYLSDLDPQNEFKDYAAKNPQTKHSKRFLLAAMWLCSVKRKGTVNIDQVFTCYRTAGWPANIRDWDSIFRNSVKQNWMRRVSSGEYVMNPLGEDALKAV